MCSLDTVDLTIDCIPAGNSVYLLLILLLFSSWHFQQDTGDLAINCISFSISAKYLKVNISLINITFHTKFEVTIPYSFTKILPFEWISSKNKGKIFFYAPSSFHDTQNIYVFQAILDYIFSSNVYLREGNGFKKSS